MHRVPSSAPGFDLVRGGFVFQLFRRFVFGVGPGRLEVAVVSFHRYLVSRLLAGAAVSCLRLLGRVRHTSTTLLN